MAYQPSRHTWLGSFRVAAGHAVTTGDHCHDDYDYGDETPREVAVGAAAGCVTPSYDFNYLQQASSAAVSARVALVGRGTCTFVQKARNAQRAGAVAMIVANNVPDAAFAMGGADETIAIPSVMVLEDDGAMLRQAVQAGQTVQAPPPLPPDPRPPPPALST